MVIRYAFLISLLSVIAITSMLRSEPMIDASIDSMNAYPEYPLEGIITITHKKEERIDPQSFLMEGKRLEAFPVKEVMMSPTSDTLVSIYQFQLPAKKEGLYVLPEISVKIGNKIYKSTSSSYEVSGTPPSQPPPSTAPTTPLIFRLEAQIEGPSTLYPGERTKFFYRISYNRSIDLTKSELPMIHPRHFQKVGDVQIKDYQEGKVTVQELTQEVEASDIGTFDFGPSSIEGYSYTMKGIQKVYDKTLLVAKAPVITVQVKPFPEKSKPPSFTGAIGNIQAKASLESPSKVSVGDKVQLLVTVRGLSYLEEVRLPLLQCVPGFSGFFQMSDLPPLAEVKNDEKLFHVEIRPATSLIQEIPSIELSSFDAATGKYVVIKTDPIPLEVEAAPLKSTATLHFPLIAPIPPQEGDWPVPPLPPLLFKPGQVELQQSSNDWLKSHRALWLIPVGLALLLLQWKFAQQVKKALHPQRLKSEEMFHQAFASSEDPSLSLLESSFWNRLWEKEILRPGDFQIDRLPRKEDMAKVKDFILHLQSLQYSPNREFDARQIKKDAVQLFAKI